MTTRMTYAERAVQVWRVLICAAHNRQTLTYEQLAKLIGMGDKGYLVTGGPRGPLGGVYYYCERNKLPPLTCLVVGKNTGRPGEDFPGLDRQRERVFNYQWFRLPPAQVRDFEVSEA